MGPKKIDFAAELFKLNQTITEIKTELSSKATEKKLDLLCTILNEKDKRIEVLESQAAVVENTINLLKEKCDNNEQYSRRTSVRIVNIPVPDELESAIDCTNMVKEVINESGADLSDECIDRAHRVGRIQVDENGSKKQAMIVKFTSWKHRTRHRKKLGKR